MDLMVLDAETYYGDDYTLSKMTTEAYVRDPRFELNIIGVKINDTPAFWLLPERWVQFVGETDWANTTVIAHHAHFDGLILSHHYGVTPAFWLDTLSMARIVDGPKAPNSLHDLCIRHGIGAKGDYLVKAKGKRLADFDRNELRAYGEYCVNDCEKEYLLAQLFLDQIPEVALRLIDLKTRFFTEPVFEGDVELLAQAVKDEAARKEALLAKCGFDKTEFSSSDKFAAILRAFDVEPPMKRSNTSGEPIFAFARTDPGMQALLEHENEDIRFLAETRLAVKSTIIETRAQRFHDCAKRGPMPVYLKPFGVHTTRSSAGDGTNWQNMTSVNKLRPEMTVLKRSIHAPQGCKIVSVDSSQIQARLVAWVSGQQDMVQAFTEGRDVYSEFASDVYQRPVDRKNNEADFIPGQVGKVAVLSFGFGQGYYSTAVNFLKGFLGAPPIQFTEADMLVMGVDPSRFLNNPKKIELVDRMPSRLEMADRLIHCIVSEAIVQRWRKRNDMVVKMWDTLETAINAMIAGTEFRFGPNGFLWTEKEAIVAPSGLRLRYRGLQRENGEATYWTGREREKLYGGAVLNNIAQILEQEIMGEDMLEIAAIGYKVAVETYDSITCVVPEEYAGQCLADMTRLMMRRRAWAPDLPLRAEGGIGNTYFEAK